MRTRMIVFTTFWLSSMVASSVEKCLEEYKKQRPTHTACLPPNKECTIKASRVSKADIKLILKTHNHYRGMVAMGKLKKFPAATNMRQLLWDEELASVAQAKADQCTNADGELHHDKAADRFTTKFKSVGQNLAFQRSSASFGGTDWPGQIKAWFDEYDHYPPASVNSFAPPSGESTGHFTQIVWALTGYVGCGYTDYTVTGAKEMPYMQLYVCNYGTAGNVLTRPIYLTGAVCTACPKGTTCVKKTGLCSPPEGTAALDERDTGSENREKSTVKPSPPYRKNGAGITFRPNRHAIFGIFAVTYLTLFT
ncbi:hypothetical protein HPB51_020001 [Rhipicephalus microplus]|uniref:SCP domain-containing protein n=1 Tax=Rhipicephalus microplus TaxID=6941 RepID=A0A9J6E3C9_RHIMP|nr:hypothetical protein HPB51_020001 [Rhipicephalus microplus]